MDLDLRTLKHRKLSVPQPVLKIDFNKPIPTSASSIDSFLNQRNAFYPNFIKSGNITAMPYWFVLQLIAPMSKIPIMRNTESQNELNGDNSVKDNHGVPFSNEPNIRCTQLEGTKTIVSTLDVGSHWKQAAILLGHDRKIQVGDNVKCEAMCEVSCVRLKIV